MIHLANGQLVTCFLECKTCLRDAEEACLTSSTVKLKEREWRFPDVPLPASGKWPGNYSYD